MASQGNAAASSSGAPQPIAPHRASAPLAEAKVSMNQEVEGLIAEVSQLGHFPKRINPAENKLHQRLQRKRNSFQNSSGQI